MTFISGRSFYKCAKLQGTDCNFFLWASDNVQQTETSANRNINYRPTANTSAGQSTSNTWQQGDISEPFNVKCHCNQLAKE